MALYEKILDRINSLMEIVVSVLLVIMVIVIFLQVIFRFVIHSSLPWSEELARYILIWISFLGASVGIRKHAHIGVEAIVNMLGQRSRRTISLIAYFAALAFFAFLFIYGHKILSIVSRQSSPAMEISMAIPYSSLLFSSILMFLYTISDILHVVGDMKRGA